MADSVKSTHQKTMKWTKEWKEYLMELMNKHFVAQKAKGTRKGYQWDKIHAEFTSFTCIKIERENLRRQGHVWVKEKTIDSFVNFDEK
jgi:hypothetical protein